MTRTARGREINMASLIAANEETVTIGNTNTNVRGDILGQGGKVEVPAQEVQEAFYEEKLTAPKETIKSINDLEEKVTNKTQNLRTTVVREQEFERKGKLYKEVEYADGSIEEKELNDN